jgi:hypothetical protein
MATATPSARRAPRRRRSSMPGYSSWTPSHPASASVFPEGVARRVSASMRRAHIPDTYAASDPESGTWKDLDPRRRSSRGSRAQNRPVCLAMALRDACGLSRLNDFLALWSQAHMPSCNRQSKSISIHSLPAEYLRLTLGLQNVVPVYRSSGSVSPTAPAVPRAKPDRRRPHTNGRLMKDSPPPERGAPAGPGSTGPPWARATPRSRLLRRSARMRVDLTCSPGG